MGDKELDQVRKPIFISKSKTGTVLVKKLIHQQLRQKRLAELQQQGPRGGGGGGGAQQQQQQEEMKQQQQDMKNSILSQVLTQEARARRRCSFLLND